MSSYDILVISGLGSQVMGCSLSKDDLKHPEDGDLIALKTWEKNEKESVRYAIENDVKYDPWEEYDQKGKVETVNNHDHKDKSVSIVDLRTNHEVIKKARNVKSAHAEAQTDSAEGVDFDWDLTDKTDTETQVGLSL